MLSPQWFSTKSALVLRFMQCAAFAAWACMACPSAWAQAGTIRYPVNGGCSALGYEMTRPLTWTASCRDGLIDGVGVLSYTQLQHIAEDTSREYERVLYSKGVRTGVLLGITDPKLKGAARASLEPALFVQLYRDGVRIGRATLRVSADNLNTGLAKVKSLFEQAEREMIPTQPWFEIEKTVRDWFSSPDLSPEAFGALPTARVPVDDPKTEGRGTRGM